MLSEKLENYFSENLQDFFPKVYLTYLSDHTYGKFNQNNDSDEKQRL